MWSAEDGAVGSLRNTSGVVLSLTPGFSPVHEARYRYLAKSADERGVYMKINFVNPDHVHALIDLPTELSVEKGATFKRKFFSLGEFKRSNYGKVCLGQRRDQVARYIADQEEHHRLRTFAEELREFIDRHGLRWRGEESR